MEELQIGHEILKEVLDKEAERQERTQQAKLSEKELREIAKRNVRWCFFDYTEESTNTGAYTQVQLNYQDDRLAKRLKDEQEAKLRAIRESQAPSRQHLSNASADPEGSSRIPLGGVTLGGRVEPSAEAISNEHPDEQEDSEAE